MCATSASRDSISAVALAEAAASAVVAAFLLFRGGRREVLGFRVRVGSARWGLRMRLRLRAAAIRLGLFGLGRLGGREAFAVLVQG